MGRKIKPCEWCEDEVFNNDVHGTHQFCVEIYPFNNIICISSFAEVNEEIDEMSAEIPMNYCPNCGRKLI